LPPPASPFISAAEGDPWEWNQDDRLYKPNPQSEAWGRVEARAASDDVWLVAYTRHGLDSTRLSLADVLYWACCHRPDLVRHAREEAGHG
jgi:hypothetical protein